MAFKPNYNQQRAERTRAKQAKKEAKQRAQEEEKNRRKTEPADGETPAPDAAASGDGADA